MRVIASPLLTLTFGSPELLSRIDMPPISSLLRTATLVGWTVCGDNILQRKDMSSLPNERILCARRIHVFSLMGDHDASSPVIRQSTSATSNGSTRPQRQYNWHRISLILVIATLIYNIAEAGIALWAGIVARSIALVGFGLDSIIETLAASALLYRISLEIRGNVDDERLQRTERRVYRFVGCTFLLLASYVTAQSIVVLVARPDVPEESLAGIILAAISLIIMPLVSWGKMRAAKEIGSAALRAEAKETLACCYLSFTLLLGLALNAAFGWWWADPAAALFMVPWLIKEGLEGVGIIKDDDDDDAEEELEEGEMCNEEEVNTSK